MKHRFTTEFHRYHGKLRMVVEAGVAVLLVVGWWKRHEIPVETGLALAAALAAGLLACLRWGATQIRKRRNAGVVGFQYEHTPQNALDRLRRLRKQYLYVGRSFESMLDVFAQACEAGGAAYVTRVRLLLANPDDPAQLEFLRRNTPGTHSTEQVQKDLKQRLRKTVAAVKDFGRVEIRMLDQPFKGWLHLFDDDTIVFGMTPRGQDGLAAPAMEIEPVSGKWTLFDHFAEWGEEAWLRGTPVKDLNEWLS